MPYTDLRYFDPPALERPCNAKGPDPKPVPPKKLPPVSDEQLILYIRTHGMQVWG